MEKVTLAKHSIFKEIKNTIKAIFISNNNVVNDVNDIMDWDDCLSNINSDSFNESDRESINSIIEAEKSLENAKNKVNSMRKGIENVGNSKNKQKKLKVIEKEDREEIIKE